MGLDPKESKSIQNPRVDKSYHNASVRLVTRSDSYTSGVSSWPESPDFVATENHSV